jgi:GGDEF domain-containing protein
VAALSEPVPLGGTRAYVGASLGIAASGPGRGESDLLLRRADQAMYAAKLAGKNQIRRYADEPEAALV